jgi:formylglycine-generating enzyme required for sulfatase activity
MGINPSIRNKGVKLPVTDVSWEDCQDFIKKLNAKTNGGYRLPTEAEWEYACRAGTTTSYSFGHKITPQDANYEDSKIGKSVAVGSYKPNAFGLYDMHGNVFEWCEDWFGVYPAGAVTDPKGPAPGIYRWMRGGAFAYPDWSAGSSSRGHYDVPSKRNAYLGFRLARTVDNKVEAVPPEPKPDPAAIMPATGNLLVAPFTEAKAKEVQKSVAKSLQKEVEEKADLGKGINLEMVLIPAGKFMMGSPASENGRNNNETQHEVTLTKPYYMGKYEITQEQWEGVMGDNPSSTKSAKLPVTGVSWKDCQGFIEKLNAKTSGGYRRPTEAEWEYACRAGTTTAYSFGDVLTKSDANCNESGGRIKEVGSYKPNAFGLYDMHGNVWEWCEDSYGDYPAGSAIDPKGPATGGSRVARGGSFNYGVSHARSSNRGLNSPTARSDDGGFRLARTP